MAQGGATVAPHGATFYYYSTVGYKYNVIGGAMWLHGGQHGDKYYVYWSTLV